MNVFKKIQDVKWEEFWILDELTWSDPHTFSSMIRTLPMDSSQLIKASFVLWTRGLK